jgi:hypothetical protein
MDANTPQALKTLASIKPDVKQQRRMGIDVNDVFILRLRNCPDIVNEVQM